MGLCTRALLAMLALVILVVPAVQLMSPVSSDVMQQHLSAKTWSKMSAGSRTPAVTGDTTALQGQGASPVGRVSLLDGVASLPGFTTDPFVPPRA